MRMLTLMPAPYRCPPLITPCPNVCPDGAVPPPLFGGERAVTCRRALAPMGNRGSFQGEGSAQWLMEDRVMGDCPLWRGRRFGFLCRPCTYVQYAALLALPRTASVTRWRGTTPHAHVDAIRFRGGTLTLARVNAS